MADMYEYRETSHFTAGAVGEPGNRVFYLQAGDAFGYHSVKLEKQQVSALATFLRTVLEDLPSPTALSPAWCRSLSPRNRPLLSDRSRWASMNQKAKWSLWSRSS